MKGTPTIKRILHFLLVVLFLLLPYLAFAEEPMPTTINPSPPSSSPTLRPRSGQALGGKEGGRDAMKFEAGEIIVKFREGVTQASIQPSLLTEDVSILDEIDNLGLVLLSVPEGRELAKIEELKLNSLVEYAEPNYLVRIANPIAIEPHYSLCDLDVEPDDPYYYGQWNLPKIEAPTAWDITTGSDKIIIAFVDSGIDLDHAELKDKIWTNPGETPGNGIDDDGNGFVDDVHGWDFVNWDSEPQDDYWHGTFMSGIAAAETNNGEGMAGVSWGAEIMPVKAMPHDWEYPKLWHLAGAIEYAADNEAKVINLSWVLTGSDYPQALRTAVDHAYSKGALVVAAAGNSFDNSYKYPAALDRVVSVAATDPDDGHPEFSTHNAKVDIAAPGVNILGIYLGFGYGRLPGTDAAAAHVSGLAALVWSVNPHLTHDEVEYIIESTAVDLGDPGWDEYFGWGRIDASAAVVTTTHYLEVEPDDGLYFLVCDDCDPPSRKITNPNTSCSTWSATAEVPWLSISDCEGYTPSWVTVSINRDSLPGYDVYTTAITATSTMANYVNNPRTITATINYTSQCWRNYLPLLFKGS
jgi:thermitase